MHDAGGRRRSSFRVNDEQGGSGHGVRVFAGPRWDPFIMDAPAALKTIATGELAFTDPGRDLPRRQERPQPRRRDRLRALLGGATLVGVVAETLTRGKFNVRIERVGRPEVKNLMLGAEAVRPGQPRPRDPRPLQHGGRVPPRGRLPGRLPGAAERQPRLLGRPRRQDRLADERRRRHPLTELVLADYLVVDVTKPYAEQGSFLEIELAARERRAARDLRRPGAQRRRDGHALHAARSTPATGRSSATASTSRRGRPRARFPYLAPPNPDPPEPPEHHH